MCWPIFIISLSDSISRRKLLSEKLIGLGHEFEIIEAIDGRKKLPEQYEPFIDRAETLKRFGRKMSDGEYACALSHQKAYDIILERDLPGAIILEDDAIPTPEFKRFIDEKSYLAGDLIQLDYANTFVKILGKKKLFEGVFLRPVFCNSYLATGYSISRKGAEYITTNSIPITAPADWPCDTTKIGAQVTIPPLIGHPDKETGHSSLKLERSVHIIEKKDRQAKDRKLKPFSSYMNWWLRKFLSVKIA